MRVNLSVTIVAMVNQSAIPHINQTAVDICPETPAGGGPSSIVKVNDSKNVECNCRVSVGFKLLSLSSHSALGPLFWDDGLEALCRLVHLFLVFFSIYFPSPLRLNPVTSLGFVV